MPIIIFKYIAKNYLFFLTVILLSVASLMFIFDFIELIKLSHNTPLTSLMIVKLAIMKNYSHVQKTFPFMFIITTIVSYMSLTRSQELIAIRTFGVSVWQFLLPSVFVAFCFGFFNILVLNPIGTSLLNKYEKDEANYLKGQPSSIMISKNGLWLKENTKTRQIIIHALRISQEERKLYDVSFFIMDKTYKFIKRIDADVAVIEDDENWILQNVKITHEDFSKLFYDEYSITSKISFLQIQDSVVSPETIPIYKLPSFISATQSSGFSVLKHLSYFYRTLISPFFLASMVLIGMFFSTSLPRAGKFTMDLFYGILTGFIIYFLSDIINAAGIAGNIPVIIAALCPTFICLSIGSYLMLHYEDG